MDNRTTPPFTIEELQQRVNKLEDRNAELSALVQWYESQFRLAQKRRFGASSEQTHPGQLGLDLFNEAEAEADPTVPEPTPETITYKRKKKVGNREAKLESLPVERTEFRLSEKEQVCPCCNGKLHEMSTEVRREVAIIPAQARVEEKVRYVYACRRCELEATSTPIVTAPMPAPVLPGSIASPSIIAHIMSQKYVDSLPLYRQEQQFRRLDLDLSRQTMANWMIAGAERWLMPLYDHLRTELLNRDIVQADETTLQVLHEAGRAAQAKSYLWLYRTGRVGVDIILYDYQPGRGGEHPSKFLAGFKGFLQTDGYSGYNDVADVTQLGCWSHARRKFHEAQQSLPEPLRKKTDTAAAEGLTFCNALFMLERKWKEATPEERYAARLEESEPLLGTFKAWLDEQRAHVLPKSLTGMAITYALNQWQKLNVFLQDGRLEIDNNGSERSIKPVVIGRKNFLFCNTPRGAKASAVIYSVVETAKANGLKPQAYLEYLFEQMPQLSDPSDPQALGKLVPWSASIPLTCRVWSK